MTAKPTTHAKTKTNPHLEKMYFMENRSFVYALIILFESEFKYDIWTCFLCQTESYTKIQVFMYFLFTYFNFNQSTCRLKKP
jgi:hypothetical protein